MKIIFDLEVSDREAAFFALYAGLRMYKEQRQKKVPKDQMSIAAAEAYCMMQSLKEQYPTWYKEAEMEFKEVYSKKFKNLN